MSKRMDILKGILSIDSTNGNEASVASYLQNVLKEVNIDSQQVVYEEGRASLVAEIGQGDRVIAVSGHMDVVSPGDVSKWTTPPFVPSECDGNLYARGASDMKSGLSAMVMALVELTQEKVALNGRVKLLATVGEEVGLYGAKQLTDEGYADDVEALIIGEPSGHRIVYAHKGVLTYKVVSHGKAAHSSMPELGVNAIDNLLVFCNEIGKQFAKFTQTNEALGSFVSNNSLLEGGQQINSVPDVASITANLRTIPEASNESVIQCLKDTVDALNQNNEHMNLELQILQDTLPVFSSKDCKLVEVAKKVADTKFNENTPLLGVPGGTDAAEFIRANSDMQIIIFGPGNETLHQTNEYVTIENYLEMVDVYKEIIVSYLND